MEEELERARASVRELKAAFGKRVPNDGEASEAIKIRFEFVHR